MQAVQCLVAQRIQRRRDKLVHTVEEQAEALQALRRELGRAREGNRSPARDRLESSGFLKQKYEGSPSNLEEPCSNCLPLKTENKRLKEQLRLLLEDKTGLLNQDITSTSLVKHYSSRPNDNGDIDLFEISSVFRKKDPYLNIIVINNSRRSIT